MIFTLPDGGNDGAPPQKIEQKGQERISRLAGRNGRALRPGRKHGDQAHGGHRAQPPTTPRRPTFDAGSRRTRPTSATTSG